MKRVLGEYFKIVMYTIFGLVLVISSYMIMLNIHHYNAISQKVVVSESDTDFVNYKNNINEIERYLNNKKGLTSLTSTLDVLKDGGVFRLMTNTKLEYHDLYILNDYFMNNIINDCWVSSLSLLNNNEKNSEMVNILANNSKYLNDRFINNSGILYDNIGENDLEKDYQFILNNYLSFSNIVLSMSKSIGG